MRTRQFSELQADAYKLADLEGFTDRYPASEVGRYINQGNAECWDLLVAARGYAYFGKTWYVLGSVTASGTTPPTVTVSGAPNVGTGTTYALTIEIVVGGAVATATFRFSTDAGTTWSDTYTTASTVQLPGTGVYATFATGTYNADNAYAVTAALPTTTSEVQTYVLPPDFYKLHQLTLTSGTQWTLPLSPVNHVDKPYWMTSNVQSSIRPGYYEIRAGYYDFWPAPHGEYTINLAYVPCATVLVNSSDTFDGINGWEDYGTHWAARKMLLKEGDIEMANLVTQDMNKIGQRITNMAAERDQGASSRVQDARGALSWNNPRRRYYGRP